MAIVIERKVSLDFLGEAYTNSFIIVRAMSMAEYDRLNNEDKDKTVREVATDHFIRGVIQQDGKDVDITKDNLDELSPDIFEKIWNVLVGQTDPKSEGQSKSPSTTDPQPQTN